MFQNERQRNGFWFAAARTSPGRITSASAGRTRALRAGDPGGQHNYDPRTQANYANMYTARLEAPLRQEPVLVFRRGETVNHGNAHYDIGAGGRGITTDCHDGTTYAFVDYSSAGPTTWGGCHPIGFSTGLHYTF